MDYSKCGFCTIAYGDYYQRIAYQALKTYKFHNKKIPFAIITDKESYYTNFFDKVVIKDSFVKEQKYFNKLWLDILAPYEKTIYIECDVLIFRDISHLFDALGGSTEHICFGVNHKPGKYNLFDLDLAKKDFPKLEDIANLEPSVLYVSKNPTIQQVYKTARQLYLKDKRYNYPFYGDEPFLSLSSCINHVKCQQLNKVCEQLTYGDSPVITFYRTSYAYKFSRFSIRANIKKKKLKMGKRDFDIMHFSTGLTNDYTYKYLYNKFLGETGFLKLSYYKYKDIYKSFKVEIKKKFKSKKW